MRILTEPDQKAPRIGFVFDAGPETGFGHAIRCLRIAQHIAGEVALVFYPLSEACARFLSGHDRVRADPRRFEIRHPFDREGSFPLGMVSDLSRTHPITAELKRQGCRHVSIRDLGLAQSQSDVVIDGSVTRIVPYPAADDRKMFLGLDYAVVDPFPGVRRPGEAEVFISLGGGICPEFVEGLARALASRGFRVSATRGFQPVHSYSWNSPVRWVASREAIRATVSRCVLAVANSGISLYEMLAAGVPTIALSVDEKQLRTAVAFEEMGAVESAGVVSNVGSADVVERASQLHRTPSLIRRMGETGRRLVDSQGLFRVTEIIRRELCPTL